MLKTGGVLVLMVALSVPAGAEEAPSVEAPLADLRAQMEASRGMERELELLHFEVDRLKLELEKKKALAELAKVEGGKTDVVFRGTSDEAVSISLRYVFMGAGRQEAVLDVDGVEHRVQPGDEVGGKAVKAISKEGVVLEGKDGKSSFFRPRA